MDKMDFEALAMAVKASVGRIDSNMVHHQDDAIRYFERGFRNGVFDVASKVIAVCKLEPGFDLYAFLQVAGLAFNEAGDLVKSTT